MAPAQDHLYRVKNHATSLAIEAHCPPGWIPHCLGTIQFVVQWMPMVKAQPHVSRLGFERFLQNMLLLSLSSGFLLCKRQCFSSIHVTLHCVSLPHHSTGAGCGCWGFGLGMAGMWRDFCFNSDAFCFNEQTRRRVQLLLPGMQVGEARSDPPGGTSSSWMLLDAASSLSSLFRSWKTACLFEVLKWRNDHLTCGDKMWQDIHISQERTSITCKVFHQVHQQSKTFVFVSWYSHSLLDLRATQAVLFYCCAPHGGEGLIIAESACFLQCFYLWLNVKAIYN